MIKEAIKHLPETSAVQSGPPLALFAWSPANRLSIHEDPSGTIVRLVRKSPLENMLVLSSALLTTIGVAILCWYSQPHLPGMFDMIFLLLITFGIPFYVLWSVAGSETWIINCRQNVARRIRRRLVFKSREEFSPGQICASVGQVINKHGPKDGKTGLAVTTPAGHSLFLAEAPQDELFQVVQNLPKYFVNIFESAKVVDAIVLIDEATW